MFIATLRKLTLNLLSQLINFAWLRLTASIKRILCYVMKSSYRSDPVAMTVH